MSESRPTQPTADVGPSLALDPETEADENAIHLDGTLVLVGCGKAKRDPDDPVDLHAASVGPDEPMSDRPGAETGPAWRAEDLYTSSYFAAKREFAELVTSWASETSGWGILSAEHAMIEPWKQLTPYDTTIDDLGDDPTNPEHRVPNRFGRRRPDGQPIVTEMDRWAARVASALMRWIGGHRPRRAKPWENNANTLLVLAGKNYIEPLRSRGVFEYGIARMAGNPNEGYKQPLRTRFLLEEIDAGGIGEQMAWLSDAIERLGPHVTEQEPSEQTTLTDGGEQAHDRR